MPSRATNLERRSWRASGSSAGRAGPRFPSRSLCNANPFAPAGMDSRSSRSGCGVAPGLPYAKGVLTFSPGLSASGGLPWDSRREIATTLTGLRPAHPDTPGSPDWHRAHPGLKDEAALGPSNQPPELPTHRKGDGCGRLLAADYGRRIMRGSAGMSPAANGRER